MDCREFRLFLSTLPTIFGGNPRRRRRRSPNGFRQPSPTAISGVSNLTNSLKTQVMPLHHKNVAKSLGSFNWSLTPFILSLSEARHVHHFCTLSDGYEHFSLELTGETESLFPTRAILCHQAGKMGSHGREEVRRMRALISALRGVAEGVVRAFFPVLFRDCM